MAYDLFISYSRRDNRDGRITELVDRIREDFPRYADRELNPFFDRHSIQGMEDWRQSIFQGLRESRLFLACLSPAYIESDYCEWEFIEYQKREIASAHGAEGVAPIYFVEVPGWEDKDFEKRCKEWVAELRRRQHFDLRPWHEQGQQALNEEGVRERMEALNRQLARNIQQGERAEKSLGNADAHNPHFQGRTASLRELRNNFVKPDTIGVLTAVNGVGGLGKTALAIEYAHAYADEYGGGRWQVRCAGQDDLRLALAQLATPMGFEFTEDEKKSPDLMLERTRRELKMLADEHEPHRSLLILDNVDRPELLAPAMVQRLNCGDWLHILATTRLGENELSGRSRDRRFVAIDELPPQDALALIEEFQPNHAFASEAERDAAREIVRLLGCFTLAVESAAVYLGQFANDVTCAAFLERLKKEGLEGLDAAAVQSTDGVLHGEKRLSATLQPTLERLGAAEKLALEFAALLPPDQVPLPWLRVLVAKTIPEIERDAEPGYPDLWKNVQRRLFSLRLFQVTDDKDNDGQPRLVRVHQLVQELVKEQLEGMVKHRHDDLVALASERSDELAKRGNISAHRWELTPLLAFFIGSGATVQDSSEPTQNVVIPEQNNLLLRPGRKVSPCILKGLRTADNNPTSLNFIVDGGDDHALTELIASGEYAKQLDYFNSALAVKEDNLHVEMSGNELDPMLPKPLVGTRLGRVLLSQDFVLKQLAASFLHPDNPIGKEYWDRVYLKARNTVGSSTRRFASFQKLWLFPKKAVVYELPFGEEPPDRLKRFDVKKGERFAYIVETELETGCECNLAALKRHIDGQEFGSPGLSREFAVKMVEIFKCVVLPHIRREVNEGEHFVPIRQVYNAIVLATWYKKKLRSVPAFQNMFEYVDNDDPSRRKTTISSITSLADQASKPNTDQLISKASSNQTPLSASGFETADNMEFYLKYIRLFRDGVFRCARAEVGDEPGEEINRVYFSGAVRFDRLAMQIIRII